MAEEAQATEQANPEVDTPSDSGDALGEAGKKALDAERKRANDMEKQAKALQAQIDQLNDAKLTETERLQKQIDELTASYTQAQRNALRDRVAVESEIPANLVPYLTGDDEAALRQSAADLKAAISEAAKPGTPKPDPSQGAKGSTSASTAEAFAQFFNQSL